MANWKKLQKADKATKIEKVVGWLKSPRSTPEVGRLIMKMCPTREEATEIFKAAWKAVWAEIGVPDEALEQDWAEAEANVAKNGCGV